MAFLKCVCTFSRLEYRCYAKSPLVAKSFKHTATTATATIAGNKLRYSEEVIAAMRNRLPVVALESTIITHGMPYPHNLKTGRDVESIVRDEGATPATIAILRGRIHVGLENNEMEILAKKEVAVTKTSRRDLPYILSKDLYGGTTVSATMLIAHRVGIRLFVTGGVGGVHRGAETSMDVSSDLTELGRTPVAVVSSGVKSILDIGKTLEYLETQGVCVATFGDSCDFPAFFTRQSGFQSAYSVASPEEAAHLIAAAGDVGLESGILIAVPIPAEHAADGHEIEAAIQRALGEAREAGVVTGKAVTPFLLQRVSELTAGKSLAANMALVKNNARVGSQIAVALANLRGKQQTRSCSTHAHETPTKPWNHQFTKRKKKRSEDDLIASSSSPVSTPVVIGGCVVDFIVNLGPQKPLQMNGSTHPGRIRQVFGGVGRNICEALQRMRLRPLFVSVVGRDSLADLILSRFPSRENLQIERVADRATATYSCVLDSTGECLFGVGDMDIHEAITPEYVSRFRRSIERAPLVVMDGNVPVETLDYVLGICAASDVPVWYEPTDINKATRPFVTPNWRAITYLSPNIRELQQIHLCLTGRQTDADGSGVVDVDEVVELARPLFPSVHTVLVTLGAQGVMLIRNTPTSAPFPVATTSLDQSGATTISAVHYPAIPVDRVVSVSGSGDCLAAGVISGLLQRRSPASCIQVGLEAASLSLQSLETVPDQLARVARQTAAASAASSSASKTSA